LAVAAIQAGLDCRKCSDDLKVERGCTADSNIPARWDIDGDTYDRCPMSQLTQQTHDYLQAYQFFKMGIMPQGGGWLVESPKFLQAMILLEQEFRKMESSKRV